MKTSPRQTPDARGLRIAVLHAAFNEAVVGGLLRGACEALKEMGAAEKDVEAIQVPGAFELPLLAKRAAATGRYAGVICLGCVIKGDTAHFEYISLAAAMGLQQASLDTGVPIAFGILTTYDDAQAITRSRPRTEKSMSISGMDTRSAFRKRSNSRS